MVLSMSNTPKEQIAILAKDNNMSMDEMLQTLIDVYNEHVIEQQKPIQHRYESLETANIRYQGLFELSNDAIFLFDLDGNHIDVNQNALNLLGYSYDELINLSVREIVKAEELDETSNIRDVLLSGEKIPIYERTLIHKDGSEIPVEVNVSCIFSEDGKPLYLQAVNRDIRERKALLESVRYSELRYRTILESMAEGVAIHDADGEIKMVNDAAEDLLGLSFEQMRGLTPLDPSWHIIKQDGSTFAGEDMPASVTLREGVAQTEVIMGVRKPDGHMTWLSVNSAPIRDDDNNITDVVVTFSDFTNLFLAQKQALKLAVERERIQLITDFVQNSSHEFRTPLSIILTSTYFIQKYSNYDPKIQRRVTEIEYQVQRITSLVDNLLWMAKLDGISQLEPNLNINLSVLLSGMIHVHEQTTGTPKINLHVDETKNKFTIPSQANYLLQGLQAIVDNAIQYSASNTEIDITLTQTKQTIEIIVSDKGVGIAPENMPHIFRRFWRKDIAHSSEGIGLGLSIAQRVIDLHGGQIHVESELRRGTNVIITLPKTDQTI